MCATPPRPLSHEGTWDDVKVAAPIRKDIVRASNGLAKSGRSLVLSAKAFSGGENVCHT